MKLEPDLYKKLKRRAAVESKKRDKHITMSDIVRRLLDRELGEG